KRLVAYVVREEGWTWTVSELREQLQKKLPEYMVPGAFVELDHLPVTSNGKLNRKALPEPEGNISQGYEAPVGEIETILARLWAERVQVEKVGRHAHFFGLGGHSLLTARLVERMRQVGLRADVRALSTNPTLAGLASVAERQSNSIEVPPNKIPPQCEAIAPEMVTLVELRPGEIERVVREVAGGAANVQDIYPLAPLQEGILFEHLLGNEGDAYLYPLLLSFDNRPELERYVDALQSVIRRHDILRTS